MADYRLKGLIMADFSLNGLVINTHVDMRVYQPNHSKFFTTVVPLRPYTGIFWLEPPPSIVVI